MNVLALLFSSFPSQFENRSLLTTCGHDIADVDPLTTGSKQERHEAQRNWEIFAACCLCISSVTS